MVWAANFAPGPTDTSKSGTLGTLYERPLSLGRVSVMIAQKLNNLMSIHSNVKKIHTSLSNLYPVAITDPDENKLIIYKYLIFNLFTLYYINLNKRM